MPMFSCDLCCCILVRSSNSSTDSKQTVWHEKEPKRLQNATVLCLMSGPNEANYRHLKCPDVLGHMTCSQSPNLLSAGLLQYAVNIIFGCHISSFSVFRQINFLIGNISVLLSLCHHFTLLWGIVAESVHDDEHILLHFFLLIGKGPIYLAEIYFLQGSQCYVFYTSKMFCTDWFSNTPRQLLTLQKTWCWI